MMQVKVVAKTTRNTLIFNPEGCKAKRINIDKPVASKTGNRLTGMLTFLVLEKLLVHHGYKFLNDEV